MKGGINLIPKILQKHRKSTGGGGNENANGKQAKKRVANSAKNKATADLVTIK